MNLFVADRDQSALAQIVERRGNGFSIYTELGGERFVGGIDGIGPVFAMHSKQEHDQLALYVGENRLFEAFLSGSLR